MLLNNSESDGMKKMFFPLHARSKLIGVSVKCGSELLLHKNNLYKDLLTLTKHAPEA